MSGKESLLLIISTFIRLSGCQYYNQQNANDKSFVCEGARDTKQVEHFFNLIFAEFHNTPPLCTCVQMCSDQPVYCYPSGCMKLITKEPIHTHIQKEDKRVTLVIKDRNVAFFSKLFEDSQNVNTEATQTETTSYLIPNIIKDRYRTLSRYKKTPKVELSYNFRQHVNTRKSTMWNIENAFASKTRWPNRQNILLNKTTKINTSNFISSVYTAPTAKTTKLTVKQ